MRRFSVKNVLLKTLQKSRENNCVAVSFLKKLQAEVCKFVKTETPTLVFSFEVYEIFKIILLYRTALMAASVL